MNVLLVEPDYRNKFPPLGLMKLSTFHKRRGDYVRFVKGKSPELRRFGWDRVYVSTLFTFEWRRTVETIRFYMRAPGAETIVGGIMASLMADQLSHETGASVVAGLLHSPSQIGLDGEECIDRMLPDYSLLDETDYEYPVHDSYFVHATRGCVRRCRFCAVPIIEKRYQEFISIREQVSSIRERFGEKKDLVLMDNNTLASPRFREIVGEIAEAGFIRGARLRAAPRYVDFNQGLDARFMTQQTMELIGTLNVRPVRIAFDDISMKSDYVQAVKWAAEQGFKRLSNYVLWNCEDTPEDFYERLRITVDLNKELGTQVFSFPMRFVPLDRTDRTYIGPHWTWRYIRGVQCILNATKGVVGIGHDFFLRAFGDSPAAFIRLISMPEEYIVHRNQHENNGAAVWRRDYELMDQSQLEMFRASALNSRYPAELSDDPLVNRLLSHY